MIADLRQFHALNKGVLKQKHQQGTKCYKTWNLGNKVLVRKQCCMRVNKNKTTEITRLRVISNNTTPTNTMTNW